LSCRQRQSTRASASKRGQCRRRTLDPGPRARACCSLQAAGGRPGEATGQTCPLKVPPTRVISWHRHLWESSAPVCFLQTRHMLSSWRQSGSLQSHPSCPSPFSVLQRSLFSLQQQESFLRRFQVRPKRRQPGTHPCPPQTLGSLNLEPHCGITWHLPRGAQLLRKCLKATLLNDLRNSLLSRVKISRHFSKYCVCTSTLVFWFYSKRSLTSD